MEHDPHDNQKAKHTFSREEAVDYLRRLADQLESGAIQISNEEVEFEGLIKVKESLKSKKGKTSVKVQFKLSIQDVPHEAMEEAEEPEDGQDEGEEPEEEQGQEKPSSYKKLKKLMSKQFKEIGKALEEGGEVTLTLAQAFCDNCDAMTTFKDAKKGESMYGEFTEKIRDLRKAALDSDPEALGQAYEALKAMKSACHKEYK